VDCQQIAALVPAADDADVLIVRVEYEITGDGLRPCDLRAVGMLGVGAAAVAENVVPARGVVEYPIGKAGAIEAVGPVGAGGGAAVSER